MWEPLKQADIVDIIAPGCGCLEPDIEKALAYIKSLGLIPRIDSKLVDTSYIFFSNSDEFRFNNLKEALYARDSKMIWCLMGGYGSMRLIPYLELLPKPPKVKLFMGFSDITALHLYFNQRWDWPTVHGPMPKHLGNNQLDHETMERVKEIIFGEVRGQGSEVVDLGLTPINEAAKNLKKLEGKLIGGNLSVIQLSIGTPWQINAKDKNIILEDIGERGYSVNRMLEHLWQAKIFDDARSIIFGTFTQDFEPDGVTSFIPQALAEFSKRIDIPVFKTNYFGHGEKNYPLVLNY